jgi:hypothetical protein
LPSPSTPPGAGAGCPPLVGCGACGVACLSGTRLFGCVPACFAACYLDTWLHVACRWLGVPALFSPFCAARGLGTLSGDVQHCFFECGAMQELAGSGVGRGRQEGRAVSARYTLGMWGRRSRTWLIWIACLPLLSDCLRRGCLFGASACVAPFSLLSRCF